MQDKSLISTHISVPEPPAASMKKYVAIGFRWRKRMFLVFVLSAVTGALLAFILPPKYESVMKIIVSRERPDPLVTTDQTTSAASVREISEEDLNSEVELMRSDDVLRKVVFATGLQNRVKLGVASRLLGGRYGALNVVRSEEAIRQLASDLAITLPKKSNIIRISYKSTDPHESAAVLAAFSKFYMDKHLAVHHPRGQFEFFDQQAERTRRSVSEAQAKLAESARKSQMFAGNIDVELVAQKLADLRLSLNQTYTAMAETEKRISALKAQLSATPSRMMTAIRTADNPQLLVQMKTTLLQLELKRTELLQKFEPSYRAVKEVEQEIAQTRSALTAAENKPVTDQTTDLDPTHEWIRSELVKSQTELVSLRARAESITRYTAQYTERARALSDGNLQQQELLATAKALEDNYQLYLRKREEARISDALDQNKVLNVSIAQEPRVPALPRRSPMTAAAGSILFALILSAGTGLASERFNAFLNDPEDLQRYLDVPVLATLPSGDTQRT